MSADIYGALAAFIGSGANCTVWLDQEPETGDSPTAQTLLTGPYVILEGDFETEYTFEGTVDTGDLKVTVCGIGNDATVTLAEAIKALLTPPTVWPTIPITGKLFTEVSRLRFGLHVEPDPNQQGQKVYKYEIIFHTVVSGGY